MPTLHSLRTWLLNSPSTLGSMTMLSNWSMPMDSSDHLSHPQMLPFFLNGSRTNPFGYVSIRKALTIFPAMSISMARMVTIAMTSLPLPDKLGKVWFFQETFLVIDTKTEMNSCWQPSGWNFLVQRNLWRDWRWNFCGAYSSHGCNEYSSFLPSTNCAKCPKVPRHDPRQVFGLYQRLFGLRGRTTWAHRRSNIVHLQEG